MKHFLSFIFILFASISWAQTDAGIVSNEYTSNVTKSAETASAFVESISINHKDAVFDENNNLYLQTIAESFMDQDDLKALVSYKLKPSTDGYQIKIDNKLSTDGDSLTFDNFREGKSFKLEILDKEGKTVANSQLTFTFLPIAEITGSDFSREKYIKGLFRLTDANDNDSTLLRHAKFRYRGHFAMGMQKKSYNVKLIDSEGESEDASYFGLREDNAWILDAMAVDYSRMRNRVSTDLWNDFSTKPYFFADEPKAHNGTRGHFVEVFLNGEYNGIYCMTEKIDRKQLKLKKIQKGDPAQVRGVLYKADQWSYSLLMGHEPDQAQYPMRIADKFDNQKDVWDGWELKHPDLEDGEPIDWQPLFEAVNVPASYTDKAFSSKVSKFFDMPVLLDYYLFIELMLATDNHGKNLYLHAYNIQEDTKLSLTPWDLDGTWGRRWNGSNDLTKNAFQDFVKFLWKYEHGENTLYKRLSELDVDQWNEKLVKRYAELRKTYFSLESLTNRFHTYRQLFNISGADTREYRRWDNVDGIHLDFDNEIDYVDHWINDRLSALDANYGYTPTNIEQPSLQPKDLLLGGGVGKITVQSVRPVTLHIYNIAGQLIGIYHKDSGTSEIAIHHAGLYIVNGEKVLVW